MTNYNVAVDKGTNRRTYQRSISARIINPIMNWLRYRIIKLRKLYLLSNNILVPDVRSDRVNTR